LEKRRAGRNRTVNLSNDETEYYAGKCIPVGESFRPCCSAELRNSPEPGGGLEPGGFFELRDVLDNVVLGDAMEALDNLPGGTVDLLIADPPYNLSKKYAGSEFKKMDADSYRDFTETWVTKVKRLLKSTASIYVCCDWQSSLIIGAVLGKHFNIRNRITWQREKGRGSKQNWKNSMEDVWYATVSGKGFTFNADAVKTRRKVHAPYKVDGKPKDWMITKDGNLRDTYPSNFWDDISVPYWSMPENTDHPAQKPEKLIAKMILASTNPGDIVLDPFLGSGSTAVAAKKLDRRYIGIEKEKEYCALAQKRLETADRETGIQGYMDGVFWERNTLTRQKAQRKGRAQS